MGKKFYPDMSGSCGVCLLRIGTKDQFEKNGQTLPKKLIGIIKKEEIDKLQMT